jgi:hypothetical protein
MAPRAAMPPGSMPAPATLPPDSMPGLDPRTGGLADAAAPAPVPEGDRLDAAARP